MTPVVLYDGDCAFCTWCATWGRRVLPAEVELRAYQRTDLAVLRVDVKAAARAVHWVAPGAPPQAGARAIAAWLVASGFPWSLAGLMLTVPPVSWLAAATYRMIASNRHRIPGPWRRSGTTCRV